MADSVGRSAARKPLTDLARSSTLQNRLFTFLQNRAKDRALSTEATMLRTGLHSAIATVTVPSFNRRADWRSCACMPGQQGYGYQTTQSEFGLKIPE
jgi:hypothetical protein